MVLEVAILEVKPGQTDEFEAAFYAAQAIIMGMKGYQSHQLQRCLESPNRYILLVNWDTLDDHTVGFRGSEQYQEWRALLHHFYDPFPTVEHYTPVTGSQGQSLGMGTEKINYIELPATDIEGTKQFFAKAFGWEFIDYGPDYTAISGAGLDGGFHKSTLRATTEAGSALVILYSANLELSLARVEDAGGQVVKPVFSFPGGRRFHFTDPSGNEYAVWSQ